MNLEKIIGRVLKALLSRFSLYAFKRRPDFADCACSVCAPAGRAPVGHVPVSMKAIPQRP